MKKNIICCCISIFILSIFIIPFSVVTANENQIDIKNNILNNIEEVKSPSIYGDFEYIQEGDTIKIVKYIGDTNREVNIPETIDGKVVDSIGENAFLYSNFEGGINIPQNIKYIEYGALKGLKGHIIDENSGDSSIIYNYSDCIITDKIIDIGTTSIGYPIYLDYDETKGNWYSYFSGETSEKYDSDAIIYSQVGKLKSSWGTFTTKDGYVIDKIFVNGKETSMDINGYIEYIPNTKAVTFKALFKSGVKINNISMQNQELTIGDSKKLVTTILPANATKKDVKFSSSNENIVTIDENGNLTGLKKGTATVYAISLDGSNITSSCKVTVSETKVNSIILNEKEKKVNVGDSFTLSALVQPINAFNKQLKWTSSDNSIATVDNKGFVRTLKSGNVLITAISVDGSNVSDSCQVVIINPTIKVSNIILNETNKLLNVGAVFKLEANVIPSNASDKDLEWASSDNNIVFADKIGNIKAIKEGNALITVSAKDGSGVYATCSIHVEKTVIKVSDIKLNYESKKLKINETMNLNAVVSPDNATNKNLNWLSSDDSIVSVDEDGNIKAIKEGHVVITASAKDGSQVSANCDIIVEKTVIKVKDILLNETNKTLNQGSMFYLNATIIPENADNKSIRWSSSNEKVALVDSNGYVKCINFGSSIITALAGDGSGVKEVCKLDVIKPTIKINKINLNYTTRKMTVGSNFYLKAYLYPSNATNKSMLFTSSNNKIATINMSGKVYLKYPGKVILTVKSKDGSGKFAKCTISVYPQKVSKIKLTRGKKKITINISKVSGAKKYEIYRSTKKSKGYKKIKTVSSRKYINKKLKSKKTYYYKVRAINGVYKGSFSNVYKIKTK